MKTRIKIQNKIQDICFSAIINDNCKFCNQNNNESNKCIHQDLNLYHQLFIDDMKSKNSKNKKKTN